MLVPFISRVAPEAAAGDARLDRRGFLRIGSAATVGMLASGNLDAAPVDEAPREATEGGCRGMPVILRKSPENEANPVLLADGTLAVFYMLRGQHVASVRSRDHGLTWSDAEVEFRVTGDTAHACRALVDADGELHVWFLQRGADERRYPGNRHLDIWYNRTRDRGTRWQASRPVWQGYCGAIRDAIQMSGGRIIVPFGAWKRGDEPLPAATGDNYTTAIYSDDGGETWQQSPAMLTSPVYPNYNGNNYGACEPCIVELSGGGLWMLIRTQTGVLYQSRSHDGVQWVPALPSRFTTSNSPAAFVKLDDGRIVLLWNNHELPPRVDGAGVYGGRDALHAAISEDDGRTWIGFRELYLDPARNDTPPRRGDRGTAYPSGVQVQDGSIVVVTGQGPHARCVLRFDPQWLYEESARADFTRDLQDWSVYKGIGPAHGWWRDRVQGARIVPCPVDGGNVLNLRRADEHDGDGAAWNFPAAQRGELTIRIQLRPGFAGARISLADRLYDPTDDRGERDAMVQVPVGADGSLGRRKLSLARWHCLMLRWDLQHNRCAVRVDGELVDNLRLNRPAPHGLSYLRLRSAAVERDFGGMVIASVDVEVERVERTVEDREDRSKG